MNSTATTLDPFQLAQSMSDFPLPPGVTWICALPDGLYTLADRFVATFESFQEQGKPLHVQVGYHYTNSNCLDNIRSQGLRTTASPRHGSVFGSGIYVATNPRAFVAYGNVGIMLLYIQGVTKQMTRHESTNESQADCLLGNKLMQSRRGGVETAFPQSPYFDEIVLQRSEQVLPLLVYPHTLINNAELLFELHTKLQWWVDQTWNQRPTPVRRILPSLPDLVFERTLRKKIFSFWLDRAPHEVKHKPVQIYCPGPQSRSNHEAVYTSVTTHEKVECPICMTETTEIVRLNKCQHGFHGKCIDTWLSKMSSNSCPVCRKVIGRPVGKSPAGTMSVDFDHSKTCNGLVGVFVITYNIPSGIQSDCHDNPGQAFAGSTRVAYVPRDGHDLLKRLAYAFEQGLIFTVGSSLTTGRPNTVTWASIHHKTSLKPEVHGFPDHGYMTNCHEELDALGVPKAADIPSS